MPETPADKDKCHFCQRPVIRDDAFCFGCKVCVCEECEHDPVNPPLGPHKPSAHRGE